jgi:hypothetical protein
MGVIVDQLDLVETEPDPPRTTGQPVPPSPGREEVAVQAMAAFRQAARRQARTLAD